ncbi:nitroreductase family protein [Prevotella communis]|uniref:nitroreductase family protein n=1 Tax=Prevotella communis TaxID=2913614 RepID=UPI001ED9D813|nr:nitroreductase family protein [Prevotella communis]UKK70521.1 nitroreductase family protein [Prevotella communis]
MNKIIMTLAFMLTSIASHAQLSTEAQAVINNIMTRASVRGFIEKPVEQEKIDLMLRAAMAAPTDKNKQPWHFVVLNTPETISSYYGDNPRAERMKKTPLVIVVCADTTRMQQGEVRDIWVQDLSASTENLLLAAHALDLGAVWTTIYPLEKRVQDVQQRLNLPGRLIPMCAIRIGYPNPERPAQPKDKWDEQKVTYGLWK